MEAWDKVPKLLRMRDLSGVSGLSNLWLCWACVDSLAILLSLADLKGLLAGGREDNQRAGSKETLPFGFWPHTKVSLRKATMLCWLSRFLVDSALN